MGVVRIGGDRNGRSSIAERYGSGGGEGGKLRSKLERICRAGEEGTVERFIFPVFLRIYERYLGNMQPQRCVYL